jgi:hypothetical protein
MPDRAPRQLPFLLRLYPRGWRSRYGVEVAEMLASERMTARTVLDLLAGAVDARVSPQSIVTLSSSREKTMKTFCGTATDISFRDRATSAIWLVAGTAVLTWLAIGFQQIFGRTLPIATLRYAAFPLSLLWASRWRTMKPYSRAAQAVILGGTAIVVIVMCAYAASFGQRF